MFFTFTQSAPHGPLSDKLTSQPPGTVHRSRAFSRWLYSMSFAEPSRDWLRPKIKA
jgi:hypothetical protein